MEKDITTIFNNLKTDEYINFFLKQDSIRNIDEELSFTTNVRYKCTNNCDVCFVNNWIPHNEYIKSKYSKSTVNDMQWRKLFKRFSNNFKTISCFDDIAYLKKYFPDQYNFYKEYAIMFTAPSFTDNGIYTIAPIILNELEFKSIFEITFSYDFIHKNVSDIISIIKKLNTKYDIFHIKIIKQQKVTNKKHIKIFTDLLKDLNIPFFYMADIREEWNDLSDFPCAIYTEKDNIFHLANGSLYLASDKLYLDFKDHVSKRDRFSVCNISQVSNGLIDIIPLLLKTKLDKYAHQATIIQNKETKFYDYFNQISSSLTVNLHFNYIPHLLLQDKEAYWIKEAIKDNEWMMTDMGLIKPHALVDNNIVSVIEKRTK